MVRAADPVEPKVVVRVAVAEVRVAEQAVADDPVAVVVVPAADGLAVVDPARVEADLAVAVDPAVVQEDSEVVDAPTPT